MSLFPRFQSSATSPRRKPPTPATPAEVSASIPDRTILEHLRRVQARLTDGRGLTEEGVHLYRLYAAIALQRWPTPEHLPEDYRDVDVHRRTRWLWSPERVACVQCWSGSPVPHEPVGRCVARGCAPHCTCDA